MAARFYYSDPDLGTVEVTDRVDRVAGWELREQAEEGSVGMSSLVLADPDMDLDIVGHRRFWVIEDDSEATNDVLWAGYTADQEIGRTGSSAFEPYGRVWTVSLVDMNGFWQKRVMIGADNKRPAETDVARMQWLLATTEAGVIEDDTTYVPTGSTTAMDKVDYRRQMLTQVVDDAAQASGKNWFLFEAETGAGRDVFAWYGPDSATTYSSDLFLTNDPAELDEATMADGTALVWPISGDTRLRRDPSRQYDGVAVEYEAGAIYRATSPRTVYRDFVAPYKNVKSKAKAIARATRLLAAQADQDEVILTTVELPKGKATMLRAGMRVPFKATHLPGYSTDYLWMRVLSCAIAPAAGGERYRLTLELVPTGATSSAPNPCAYANLPPAGTYAPLNNNGDSDVDGYLLYGRSGNPPVYDATPYYDGYWNFPVWGSGGSPDYHECAYTASNYVRFFAVGPGEATIHTVTTANGGAAPNAGNTFKVEVYHVIGTTEYLDDTVGDLAWGSDATITVPDDGECRHYIQVTGVTAITNAYVGFSGLDWTPA